MAYLNQYFEHPLVEKVLKTMPIPADIRQNLNPKFELRPYQEKAFKQFFYFMDEDNELCNTTNHVLFQMATGSGKTIMMAGLMLYLYEQGYRNFLFFVNSTTIIDKTKDNFMNAASAKYLFAQHLKLQGKTVNIVAADNFEGDTGDDICIVFETIQGLHSKLTSARENAITFSDFEDKKVVLIADEAHHLSAETKKGTSLFSETDEDEIFSWEGAVLKILNSNKQNLLLDFTATAELDNEHIAAKYEKKLLFDYPLKAFRQDGYSKEVEILRADSDMMQRAVQAAVLSHYRKKLFADMGQHIKPVILFKSKNIEPSKQFMADFIAKMVNLKVSDIENIRKANTEGILKTAFDYFETKNLSFEDLMLELQLDFGNERCVSANDDKEKAKLQIQLNTLESHDNAIRAVFAVDKLNEGWDVLNLFDIVRLYETRDSGKGKIGKSTVAEAQLIGRGARYCPFEYEDFNKGRRKFDADLKNPLRICETMYYHSNNDSRYVGEITKALIITGIISDKLTDVKLHFKPSFKNSNIYKNGLIFLNEQYEVTPLFIDLGAEVRQKIYEVNLLTGKTVTSKVFKKEDDAADENISKTTKILKIRDLGVNVLLKALHSSKGFDFKSLQKRFQKLESLHEFITSEAYLSNIQIHITGSREQTESITQEDKLRIAKQVLKDLQIIGSDDEKELRGTKIFKAMPLKTTFKEKTVTYPFDYFSPQEIGQSMGKYQRSLYYDPEILEADWYAFNDCYGTEEEKALVKFMKAKQADLAVEYEEFYVLRNERHFAIFDFDKGRRFEPDFVLFLKKKNEDKVKHYQIFIEPKGKHLMKLDRWKEDFLVRLHDEASVEKSSLRQSNLVDDLIKKFWQDDEFTVWGLPFYNENDGNKKMEFSDTMDKILK